ncbi:MAG: S16 family serine protease [Candidatus Hadarchaeales archaeon]
MRRRKKYRRNLILSTSLGFTLGLLLGMFIGFPLSRSGSPRSSGASLPELLEWIRRPEYISENVSPVVSGRAIDVLAVASGAQPFGVVCTLGVKVVSPGHGGVYLDIDPTLIGFEFQEASRTAIRVACQVTGLEPDEDNVGISGVDVFFRVVGPGEEVVVQNIDGPSAGAATTVALIAALENKRINPETVITGTIQPDGSVGEVGGIYYKAKAAAEKGKKLLLVPSGQSKVIMYQQVTRQVGWWRWTTYQPVEVDLNEWSENQGWGLEIREVSNIQQVIELMLE